MCKTNRPLRDYTLIAIAGKQYSGKDALTRLLLQQFPDFQQVPIARAIKKAYAAQHGLTVEDVEQHKAQHRPGLISLGNWGRAQDPDYWLRQVLTEPGKKIISDVRLQREYNLLKAEGAFLIRMNADRAIRAQRGTLVSEDDPTESELDAITAWDALLTNNGTVADLQDQVASLLAP
jgi:phosphomevalonate kinase